MALLSGSQLSVLGEMPIELRASVTAYLESFHKAAKAAKVRLVTHPDLLKVLWRVWSYSEYVAESSVQDPAMLAELIGSGDLLTDYSPSEFLQKSQSIIASLGDESVDDAQLMSALRHFRCREMVRIAWRDLAKWSSIDTTMRELSGLADATIQSTVDYLYQQHCEKYGVPYGNETGQAQPLVVIAMGKLGANELNFSSDVDLIFCFPEDGETRGAKRIYSNEEFFTRLCQSLIKALDKKTEDGFVFRVDTRLRPFGTSGPLAVSYDFLRDYLESHGREWERYAMVKARAITGDSDSIDTLNTIIAPFVYRRYLDYGSVDELRSMKAAITADVKRKSKQNDIKLGSGGIREIEFIGQTFQLMRGGWQSALRQRSILITLDTLGRKGYLPQQAVEELSVAYRFLRRLENRIQEWRDEQLHSLPTDETDQLRIALAMDFANWQEFSLELAKQRENVSKHFEALIAPPDDSEIDNVEELAASVWQAVLDDTADTDDFDSLGYADSCEAITILSSYAESSYKHLPAQARKRVDKVIPALLVEIGERGQPELVLRRTISVIEAISGRVTYLVLLHENRAALTQFVTLCAASPWLTDQLVATPILMDQLLDAHALYIPLDSKSLAEELNTALIGFGADDLDQQMEVLRHFKMNQVLRVAAADVAGVYPLMEVSDHLTSIAETILNKVVNLVWIDLSERYGRPCVQQDSENYYPGIAVIAYGKMGGIELSYGSDLDLVFLHDSHDEGITDGSEPIENAVFFARLVQRVMHIMGSHTPSGILYEMDLRLRPSGASGLLVSSVDAFFEYQDKDAWTWEHQALVRARAVAGHERVIERFKETRQAVLARQRDDAELKGEVSDMRQRMRSELSKSKKGEFDLKQDDGGIADIEFIVQYLVLRWARSFQELTIYTDNIRQLESLSNRGLLAKRDATILADSYRQYRSAVHRQTLQGESSLVKLPLFEEQREAVRSIWDKVFS